jgi:hypothetical protein
MTIIASIDPTTSPRRVFLHADTVGVDFQPMDAYKEMRALRASDESLRPYDVFMTAQGNEPTGATSATPRRVKMENTKFIPFDTDHTLTVIGEVITSDGGSGTYAFDRTPLSVGTEFNINYVPPQVEIITLVTGSGVTAQDKIDIASGVWSKVIETLTAEEIMRVMLAAMAGKRQGLGTATEQYLDVTGTVPRITLSGFDANGNGTPLLNPD